MIFRYLSLSILLAFLLNASANALDVGKSVPPLEFTTFDGNKIKTADLKGKVLIINVWASWCSYCRQEMPDLETYYRRHKDQGLHVVAVTIDDEASETKAREIMKNYGFTAAIGRLSNLHPLGNISRLPLTFVIDRKGVLRKNGLDGDPKIDLVKLEKEVTPLLKSRL